MEKLRNINCKTAKFNVVILRVIIGVIFIFSGFVKGDDLWGFIYKIEEYLSIFDWTLPRSVTIVLGMTIATVEAVSGLLLIVGAYRRAVPLILGAMMSVMLPVTFWLFVSNPIEDCGCFGDAIVLSNGATFCKNIFITLGVLYLIKYNKYVKLRVYDSELQWLVGLGGLFYMCYLCLVCYNVQPIIDFRPYPEGINLKEEIEQTGDDILFVYTNGTETKTFTAENIPEGDEWRFVDRIESENTDAGHCLSIFDGQEDVSDVVISDEGRQMLFVVPEMNRVDLSYTYFVNELYRKCEEVGIDFIALLATDSKGIDWWKDYSMANYECYSSDDTELKSLVRGKMAIVYIENGVIVWKRTISSLVDNAGWQTEPSDKDFPEKMVTDLHALLWKMTGLFVGWLCVLGVVEVIIRKANKKKKS